MDPQLKERLIGAAVLVALGVWLIPWVLDGPVPAAEEPDSGLELPAAEETPSLRTQTIDLGPSRNASATPVRLAREERSSDGGALAVSEPEAVAPPAPEPREAAAARPEVEAAPARPVVSGDWMVQLGSFSERENAERLAKRVATYGLEPEVSTFRAGGRAMYRVRVGPHDSRDLAEAAASSLSAHGFVASVVTTD